MGVGRHPNKDMVSLRTAILPTPTSPLASLLQIHNGVCALTKASSIHCPSRTPRLLPALIPRHPLLCVLSGQRQVWTSVV